MHVRCPHCRNPIDVVDDASLQEILCPSCGSSFSLIGNDATESYRTDKRRLAHFELMRELGIGKYGSVWLAHDTQLDRTVAVKIPRKGALDAEETAFFLRDARAAAQLKHPHIVGVHEVGREGETVFIVSDCIEGANLHEWLSAERPTTRAAIELVVKIAEALDYAHEHGVVHRDLKPSNIMLDRNGEPHLIDFGLAKREAGEVTMTMDGHILGTPAYMSPEQAAGKGHGADRRSDIYSLGVILFELLTGQLPFHGSTRALLVQIENSPPPRPRKLDARVPRDLETITLACLEKDPSRRYPTGAELAADLKRWLAGEPIRRRPVGRIERAWRWSKRNPALATLAALNAVAIGALVAVFALQFTGDRAESLPPIDEPKAAQAVAEPGAAEATVIGGLIEDGFLALAREVSDQLVKKRPDIGEAEPFRKVLEELERAEVADSERKRAFEELLNKLGDTQHEKIDDDQLSQLEDLAKSPEESAKVSKLQEDVAESRRRREFATLAAKLDALQAKPIDQEDLSKLEALAQSEDEWKEVSRFQETLAESRRRREFTSLLARLRAVQVEKVGLAELSQLRRLARSPEELVAVADLENKRAGSPSGLAHAITLPARTVGPGAKRHFAVAGKLSESALEGLQITLDDSLCNLSAGRRFVLVPSSEGEQRYWSFLVSEPGSSQPELEGRPPDDRRLAYFTVTPQRQLVFQWGDLQFAEHEQLANAILRLSYLNAEHELLLRQPQVQEPLRLDLSDNTITHNIPIQACPVPSSIYCEIASLDNFRPAPAVEPANRTLALGEKGRITLGTGPATLELGITFDSVHEDGQDRGDILQLRIDARYRPEENARTRPFKAKTVKAGLAVTTRTISRNVRDLSAAIAANRAATVELARAQNTKPRDLTQATELNNRLQLALQKERSSASAIRKIVDRLPGQYAALERLYQVALIGQTLHQYGRIQLRIVAKTENDQILLVSCEAEPPKLEGPVVLEGFEQLTKSAAGSWLQASRQGALTYDLAVGGQCQIRDLFAGRAVAGQWEQVDQRVKISAGGSSQDCQMVSPFQLRSSSGASLYRVF